MPIDPLLNLALQVGTKLIGPAFDQYEKLKKSLSDGTTSSEVPSRSNGVPSRDPSIVVYRCPKCAMDSEFPNSGTPEIVICWKCNHHFPVVEGCHECVCGTLIKPLPEQDVVECYACRELVSVWTSKKFVVCDCGNVFHNDNVGVLWNTECCKRANSTLRPVPVARRVRPMSSL